MANEERLSYWNSLYSTENFFGTGPTKLAKFASDLLEQKTMDILEIGCGQGRDAIFLASLGHNVHAFDISPKAIEHIKNIKNTMNLRNLNIFTHNVENPIPFQKESFDFIYSNLALQFFDKISLKQIIDNIENNMKKNSLFLFSTKKVGDKYHNFGNKVNDFAYEYRGITRYFYEDYELKNILSNFEIVSFEEDKHENLDNTVSEWWKILVRKI